MRGVQPAVLLKESNRQLLQYIILCVSYSTFSTNFHISEMFSRGPGFYYNYLINYTISFIIVTTESKLLLGMYLYYKVVHAPVSVSVKDRMPSITDTNCVVE